jgi:glycyl-tRNA synthetase beta chain
MRWGQQETPFLRPIAWLLALLDDTPLQLEVAGVRSGSTTRGHRYLAPGQLQVKAPAQYAALLEEAWVLADRNKRRQVTQQGIDRVAAEAGLTPLDDAELLDEVTDLVEWPFPIGGTFEAEYLELPEEVLATVMISHQRFFPTRAASGKLAASFVGVSNNRVVDEAVVRRGYQQVLAGRLYDARFFWQADRRKSLSQHAWDLSGIAFQKELGSMADKTDRVSVTAGYLLEALGVLEEQADALRRALPIFRADLATEMVYEFPELEGVMGRAYALAEGLPQATADALLGGVKPKTHEDDLPATAPGAVLALADRADKLIGFFALGKRPSGSADPFGLRRDGLAMARILAARGWDLPLIDLFEAAAAPYAASADLQIDQQTLQEASEFVWDRVAAQLQERASVPVVRAAIRGSRTIVGAARRVELLNYLTHSPDFGDLMALYKRAANLAAKAEESAEVNPELFREAPEAPLYLALDEARTGVQRLLSAAKQQLPAWDLRDAPAARLTDLDDATRQVVDLRPPLDAFLDDVLVMVDDQRIKANRLALLSEVVVVLRRLGELGELEGAE